MFFFFPYVFRCVFFEGPNGYLKMRKKLYILMIIFNITWNLEMDNTENGLIIMSRGLFFFFLIDVKASGKMEAGGRVILNGKGHVE